MNSVWSNNLKTFRVTPALYPFDINSDFIFEKQRNQDTRSVPVHPVACPYMFTAQGLLAGCSVNINRNNALLSGTLNI